MRNKLHIAIRVAAQIALLPISIVSFDKILTEFGQDTFNVTNGLAVFAAAISALCYTAASVERDGSRSRVQFIRSGRQFFTCAMAGAIGSVLKYAFEQAVPWAVGHHVPRTIAYPLAGFYGGCVGLFFYCGMLIAHIALWGLSGLLVTGQEAEQPAPGDADKPRA